MIVPTPLGRIQTKLATYPLLAFITLPFVWLGGEAYVAPWLLTMAVGLVLEMLWAYTIMYQPGWLTILFGILEFELIALIVIWLGVPLSFTEAAVYYAVAWVSIQLCVIYLLPVLHLAWVENGGELW